MDEPSNGSIDTRPQILWENIRASCKPIGEQGYYADCYFSDELSLVVKKYRDPSHSNRVSKELKVLLHLEQLEPSIFRHRLTENGTLIGFTLPFYRGKVWDEYMSSQNTIFRKSPVARVLLAVKLWQIVKQLQQISICHGDIHFENILIDADETNQDFLSPQFTIKLIDYGNAFVMEPGALVSQGLNGWKPLIPPEAEFSYKKNYDPFGINAYQLARICFFILLQQKFSSIEQKEFTPLPELSRLHKCEDYPIEIYELMRELVHYNISRRNEALRKDWRPFVQKTRQIFLAKLKQSKEEYDKQQ